MKQLALVSLVVLSAIIFFLLAGCGGSGSQAEQEGDHAHHSHSASLALHPVGDSGVSGTATFKDLQEDGVIVKLELRGLAKPNTLYLAHIHPGSCAQEEEEQEGQAHVEHGHEHDESGEHHEGEGDGHAEHGEEIEYALSQVKSDSEGRGSSTTTLHETSSVEKLFSGESKYLNVHEAGSGNPPTLTCAELKEAG
jgi:hypothetical protein